MSFWKPSKKQVDEKQITSSTTVEASPETVKTEIDPTEQSNNASNKSEKDLISEKLLELNQKEEELKEKEKLLESREKAIQAREQQKTDIDVTDKLLQELKESFLQERIELTALLNKLEDKLSRRETDLQQYQEDIYRKMATPYIRQFITLGDMIQKVLFDSADLGDMIQKVLFDSADNTSAFFWQEQLSKIRDSINYILKDFSVKTYTSVNNNNFDPEKQEVASYWETTDILLDKKVRRSLAPGYIWTLPYIVKAKANGEPHPLKAYEFILRKEQVETYKLSK